MPTQASKNNAARILDMLQASIDPVRLKLDGAPVTAYALMAGSVEISANMAIEAAADAVAGLAAIGAEIRPHPSKGVVCAQASWGEVESLVAGGRLSD